MYICVYIYIYIRLYYIILSCISMCIYIYIYYLRGKEIQQMHGSPPSFSTRDSQLCGLLLRISAPETEICHPPA